MANNLQSLENAIQIALDTAVMTETALRGSNVDTTGVQIRNHTIPLLRMLLTSEEVPGSIPMLRRILDMTAS